MAETYVFVRFQFEAFHRWTGAPDEHYYLRDMHRHMFHVELRKRVNHEDREIEFIQLKRDAVKACDLHKRKSKVFDYSCETWASWLRDRFDADWVSVSEDNENGAIVSR